MRIAFATIYDLDNINKGSGTYYHMYNEMKRQGINVFKIGPLEIEFPIISKMFRVIAKRFLKKRYRSYQDPFVGRVIGRTVTDQLSNYDYDILLTNDYAIAGYTKIDKPIVLWTDAVFPYDYKTNNHPWLKNLPWFAVKFCQAVTIAGLKSALTFVPAHWNANELIKYGLNENNKINIIPFGANLNDPGRGIAQSRLNIINIKNKLDILFVGKDIKGKRLDIAIETTKLLNDKGVKSCLHIVGLENNSTHPFTNYYGILDKGKKEQQKKLIEIYSFCDIFLLPSIAEGFGIAYMEASAFGMPQIGCITQGVTTAVKDGVSGKLLNLDEKPIVYAKTIMSWIEDKNYYNQLVLGARKHFENNGQWEKLISRFIKKINQII